MLCGVVITRVGGRTDKTTVNTLMSAIFFSDHYNDVIMGTIASQITSLTIVYWTVYSGADQRKHQSSASLAFVRGIHRWPVNSPHKWPVTRKIFRIHWMTSPCHFQTWQGNLWPLDIGWGTYMLNTLKPKQNGPHLADNIRPIKCIFQMNMFVFWFKFQRKLLLRVKVTINDHWLK